MNRIQKVSKCLRLVLQYGIPLWFVSGLGFSVLVDYGIKVPFFQSTRPPIGAYPPVHSTMFYVDAIALHAVLLLILFLFWYRIVLKLFGFFERGVLFTAETVRSLQILGGLYIANFFLELVFGFIIPDIYFGMTNLFTGFLIIFIGWLIDEARKIQEEQELTV